MLSHARRRLQRVWGLVPPVWHALHHLVVELLVDFRAFEAFLEGLTFVQEHVVLAGVHDDVVGQAVAEEGCRCDAGAEVWRVEADTVGRVQVGFVWMSCQRLCRVRPA